MFYKYLLPAFKLNFLIKKRYVINRLPIIGKRYQEGAHIKDHLKIILLKSQLQEKIMKDMFGEYIQGVVFDTYNGVLTNSLSDILVNESLGFRGEYDKKRIFYLLTLVNEDSCVYVIGSHVGSLIFPIARTVKKLVAFEANPETFKFLEWNVSLSRLTNIEPYNLAIYSEKTELSFYKNKVNSGGSKIKPVNDRYWYNYDSPETIKVEGAVLDDFVMKNDTALPDLMIMDIEGAEFAALTGADTCLRYAKYLYIEFIPHHLSDVAGVSLEKFVQLITKYFTKMSVIDEVLQGDNTVYINNDIFEKLTDYYQKNRGTDLIFFK